ncbi:hypothetical protein IMG5_110250 [Ichthyophthirius multifiliis]|uniref:3-dehydroquinate synthase C-terminal domain-containing protein n=1 Tax=Ichthyophthirius multifiliis TaxID=5932 RepID=G0QTN6_ICHMU|nr:hypothetical protein IMG5_110250 [Ichthyophthirius multifiliis]EGR31409.1 hypothetical protein IMG5_110250 [Ichthyophthirius multifiliis]|eukprot:XP_004034895.1 hypothetical protein IMG5_110250 [Ichthyophthirius multifiliis]
MDYPNILFIQNPLQIVSEILHRFTKVQKYCIITDENIEKLYLPYLKSQFNNHQIYPEIFILKSGEQNKKFKSVVEQDKYEQNIRKILNYGHTLGHGIEYASKGKLLHGEAVSIGIVLANKLSQNIQKQDFDQEIKELLEKYGLPVEYPDFLDSDKVLQYIFFQLW